MMEPKQVIASQGYALRKVESLYIFTNEADGCDVFYYNSCPVRNTFPIMISINPEVFNDAYLSYILNKLKYREIDEIHFPRYLTLFFNRLIRHKLFSRFYIENYLLDKNNKLDLALYHYFTQSYISFDEEPQLHFTPGVPYTAEKHNVLFSYVAKRLNTIFYDKIEVISRQAFEIALVSKSLGMKYADFYNECNTFYHLSLADDDDFKGQLNHAYFMFTRDRLNLFFVE